MKYFKKNPIRELAKSPRWQCLYARAKELATIKLFKNDVDFTEIQLLFLTWLEVYNSLNTDLVNKEDYISEEVIEDSIRTDAYLLWRRKYKDNNKEAPTKTPNKSKRVAMDNYNGVQTVNFE